MALTDLKIRKLKRAGVYAAGHALYLRVHERRDGALSKSWFTRYPSPITSKRREWPLGHWPRVSLKKAGEDAEQLRVLVRSGVDPLEARKQAKREAAIVDAQAKSFAQAFDDYKAAHGPSWKNAKHAAQWSSTLAAYVVPHFGDKPVGEVTTDDVLTVLQADDLWNTKQETSRRIRSRIELVLQFAITRGWRAGPNPAAWRGHLEHLLSERRKPVRHHAAMAFADVPQFMAELAEQDNTSARAMRFLILTATRTSETLGATWKEFENIGARQTEPMWRIPATRMKSDAEHAVPLSTQAVELLRDIRRAQPSDAKYVFAQANDKPLSNMSLLALLRRAGKTGVTTHGMRSAFSDWCFEADVAPELAELSLAHTVGSKVHRAYRRTSAEAQRRLVLQRWADFATGPRTGGNVVALNGRRRKTQTQ